ncbi:MAG: flagellin [Phycisphaeraceae bacterium]
MSRINTNVQSMLAQRVLGQNNNQLNQSLERLSTGLKINRGADDPAGLIASENLRSEKVSIESAIGNAERADQVVNIAEGGLQEVNSLLLELQSLVGESANDAGLSQDERAANQQQIDSILQTIDRISSTTSFQGTKLLNGTFDFTVSGQDNTVSDFQINAAKLGFDEQRDVQMLITQSAQQAGLYLSLGGVVDLADADSRFTFEVAGALGSREFTFASGTTLASVVDQINTFSSVTGVSAATYNATGGSGVLLNSTETGSNQFVSVDVIDDGGALGDGVFSNDANNALSAATTGAETFASITNPVRDEGVDVGAIINGISATARGNTARINTDFLDVEITLSAGGSQNLQTIDAFTITGGGAKFNLGPNVDIQNQVSLGIGNVAARNLGTVQNGFLDELGSSRGANVEDGDLGKAQKIVDNAISQVSSLRGRLGAFQKNIVGATIRSLGVALENTAAAESLIRDTDFAEETAELTRSQILSQSAQQSLSLSNSQPQQVLQLLG